MCVGVGVPAGVGVVGGAWVTVNVAVATPPAVPVAVTVYVPGDTDGTVKATPARVSPNSPVKAFIDCGVVVPTFFVPKSMFTGLPALNWYNEDCTVVPGGPWEGLNIMDWFCAFATGVTITANVNTLRKMSISVALLNFLSISIRHFCNEIVPLSQLSSLLADIRFGV